MARFVLVDDSKVARNFLREVLENVGYTVVAEGKNGVEGLQLYEEHKPDIITLDMVMPICTGMECLKLIKEKYPDAKVIMVTSVSKDSLMEDAKALGAQATIVKPFEQQDILETVAAVL